MQKFEEMGVQIRCDSVQETPLCKLAAEIENKIVDVVTSSWIGKKPIRTLVSCKNYFHCRNFNFQNSPGNVFIFSQIRSRTFRKEGLFSTKAKKHVSSRFFFMTSLNDGRFNTLICWDVCLHLRLLTLEWIRPSYFKELWLHQ